ncbi:MAG TPA: redoxin family protein [Planctomycetota bacterium]|nr:redoxin family protein [Planctomycetota bacterium]
MPQPICHCMEGTVAGARWLRTGIALVAALALLLFAGVILWREDLRYSLPTPRPPALAQPAFGAQLLAAPALAPLRPLLRGRPLLLHFYNPDCPCSRFNVQHLQQLQRNYQDRVDFVAVLQSDDPAAAAATFAGLALAMPGLPDRGGAIAAAFGVYSTPQAVLLDAGGRLFFRGNYNSARYCIDRRTAFAQAAIERLLVGRPPPPDDPRAGVAYGCELPDAAGASDDR